MNTNNNPYGHLLDKYLEAGAHEMEIMEECEEKNARYGELLERNAQKRREHEEKMRWFEQ